MFHQNKETSAGNARENRSDKRLASRPLDAKKEIFDKKEGRANNECSGIDNSDNAGVPPLFPQIA